MKLRNLSAMQHVNLGRRSLLNSILASDVQQAISDWLQNGGIRATLIGGIALSFYAKPRYTPDFELLFLHATDVPEEIKHFRAHGRGSFEHTRNGVEAKVSFPEATNLPRNVAQVVFDTAITSDSMRIASPSGLVASMLSRFSMQDQADIAELAKHFDIDLSAFPIPEEWRQRYEGLLSRLA